MPYRLRSNEFVQKGIRCIVGEQIDRAIGELHDPDLAPCEAIHQVRKRCKKVRAVLKLVRPAIGSCYSKENACYRDAARALSNVRDAQAMIETYDRLRQRYAADIDGRVVGPIGRRLRSRTKDLTHGKATVTSAVEELEQTIREGRKRLASWALADDGFPALSGALRKNYGRPARPCERPMIGLRPNTSTNGESERNTTGTARGYCATSGPPSRVCGGTKSIDSENSSEITTIYACFAVSSCPSRLLSPGRKLPLPRSAHRSSIEGNPGRLQAARKTAACREPQTAREALRRVPGSLVRRLTFERDK
jgi:hypothetical protein